MTLASKKFSEIITFTRSSTATYVNSVGLVASAAVDTPRFEYDPVTLAAKGLLNEPAATNLFTYGTDLSTNWSSDGGATLATNATTSPTGGTNASQLQYSTTAYRYQNVTLTAAPYTYSLFAKIGTGGNQTIRLGNSTLSLFATFNLSTEEITSVSGGVTARIVDFGDGWKRCSISFTGTAVSTTLDIVMNGTFSAGQGHYFYGAQIEAGSFATSFIPTTTATVTRSADSLPVTGTAFSDWFNVTEGTFYAEVTPLSLAGTLLAISDNTANEVISIANAADSHLEIIDGGVTQADIDAGTLTAGTTSKIAVAFKANDFAACIDGGTVATDVSGTLPTVSRMYIGAGPTGTGQAPAHFKNIRFYPSRLTNAQLQDLTT